MDDVKNILVPVDFNNTSIKALQFAAYLQKSIVGKIVLLHVSKSKNNNAVLKEKLQSIIAESKLSSTECTIQIEYGNVTDVIIDAQKNSKAGLIVMGTRGANSIGRELIGTNTYNVIKNTKCPVVVIPVVAEFNEVKTVVLATDNHSETLENTAQAIKFVNALQAKLLVLHINPSMDKIAEVDYRLSDVPSKITKYIDYDNMEMHVSSHKDIRKGIESFVKKHEADLLIMITHHRSAFEAVFEKSHTKQMVFYSDLPMLVIPS